jgi:hypothetical protein
MEDLLNISSKRATSNKANVLSATILLVRNEVMVI